MSCDSGFQYCGPDGAGECIANTDWCCEASKGVLGLPETAYFVCQTFTFCPAGLIDTTDYAAPQVCCQNPNQVVCPDGNCYDDSQVCSTETPAAASTTAPPPPPPSSTPAPVQTSAAPPPSSSSASTCANGECGGVCMEEGSKCCGDTISCAGDWFCSTDTPPHCCPEEGQSLCADADTCYKESEGQICCGNTLCWPGQSCAPGGNSCVGTSSSMSPLSSAPSSSPATKPASSNGRLSTAANTNTLSTVLIPSDLATNLQESSALGILQTAVPQSAQSNPAGACFLHSAYTSEYTTPPWYTAMPSNAQSYFASVNAQNTLACKDVASSTGGSDNSGGLSDGAKAGVAIGSIAGAAALAALIYFLIKGGMAGLFGSSAAGAGAAASNSAPMAQHWNGVTGGENWSGVTGGEHWSGVTGSGGPPAPSNVPPVPPIVAAAATRRGHENDGYIPYRQSYSSPPSPPPPSGTHSFHTQVPPPRSVSPLNQQYEQPRPEMYGGRSWHASEMSGDHSSSHVTEMWTNANRPELH